jgi:hypothetical protein
MLLSYDICRLPVNGLTNCVVDAAYDSLHPRVMLTTEELLGALKAKGVRNIEIARVLNLPDSRVPEIRDRRRALKLDEAAKLVQAFELEPVRPASPLSPRVIRLLVQYVAMALGVPRDRVEARLGELTEDLRAFSEFVGDPKVRHLPEAAEGFFRALVLRRPRLESEAEPGSDPAPTH